MPEESPEQESSVILKHFLEFSQFTYPGCYLDILKALPEDIEAIGKMIRSQFIPPIVFAFGNRGYNKDLRYGDMNEVPWFRQREDDYFPTATSMTAELFRRDQRGLTIERAEKDRLIVSCRYISVLTVSILKSKGIPARSRSGFAPYFRLTSGKSTDHWVNQYWNKSEERWVTIDIDILLEDTSLNPFDIPAEEFDFAADVWLGVRKGELDQSHFVSSAGYCGLPAIVEALFQDFHCLMNNEILYTHFPEYIYGRLNEASLEELSEIDALAELMLGPDKNFNKLMEIWNERKKFRILRGGLL